MSITVSPGFKKADGSNIPKLTSEMVFAYITKLAQSGNSPSLTNLGNDDFKIDYVQVMRKEKCTIKGLAFLPDSEDETKYKVKLIVNERENEVCSAACEECNGKAPCAHAIAFLFWVHRKSTENEPNEIKCFWGSTELVEIPEDKPSVIKMKDVFADENKVEMDEYEVTTEEEGQQFLKAILDEMEKVGLTDTPLYKHCRPVIDEFESLYIHHTMLDNANNYVKDYKSFIMHMEEVARRGLFDQLREVSAYNYKKQMWMETQYGRIRCSQMHRIAARKTTAEDEEILDSIFCTDREWNLEERRQLKEHKRFILKQTEKLENKEYKECGLILGENYPFICASPDGITDDHVVEIKAPKTDEEFEKYLVGKETIAPKYMAQIQIQMYLANVNKALYCVLSPTFETNGALHYVWVQSDMQHVVNLLSAAEDFWKDVVFPKMKKIYLEE